MSKTIYQKTEEVLEGFVNPFKDTLEPFKVLHYTNEAGTSTKCILYLGEGLEKAYDAPNRTTLMNLFKDNYKSMYFPSEEAFKEGRKFNLPDKYFKIDIYTPSEITATNAAIHKKYHDTEERYNEQIEALEKSNRELKKEIRELATSLDNKSKEYDRLYKTLSKADDANGSSNNNNNKGGKKNGG